MGVFKKTFLKKAEKDAALAANEDDDISFDEPENEEEQDPIDEGGQAPRRVRGSENSIYSCETNADDDYTPPPLEPVRRNHLVVEHTSEPRIRVSADVPVSVHKKLKYHSLNTGKTIQTIIRDWIIQNCPA